MRVILSTGRAVEIAPLKMGQLRKMTDRVTQGQAMDATVDACVDAMRNSGVVGAEIFTPAWFEDEFTVTEANELFVKVVEVSGITMGEAPTIH